MDSSIGHMPAALVLLGAGALSADAAEPKAWYVDCEGSSAGRHWAVFLRELLAAPRDGGRRPTRRPRREGLVRAAPRPRARRSRRRELPRRQPGRARPEPHRPAAPQAGRPRLLLPAPGRRPARGHCGRTDGLVLRGGRGTAARTEEAAGEAERRWTPATALTGGAIPVRRCGVSPCPFRSAPSAPPWSSPAHRGPCRAARPGSSRTGCRRTRPPG